MSGLVDSRTTSWINKELEKSNNAKKMYHALILNSMLLVVFIVSLCGILYVRYRNKQYADNSREQEERNRILRKISSLVTMSSDKAQQDSEMITNLPELNNYL